MRFGPFIQISPALAVAAPAGRRGRGSRRPRWGPARPRARVGDVVVAEVARTDTRWSRSCRTRCSGGPREALLDPVDELGRSRGPAAADAGQLRRVELGEARRLEQVPALGRHPDELRSPSRLDEPERGLGVPAVHHHQLQPGAEAREHHRDAAGDVEQRHDQDERRRLRGLPRAAPSGPPRSPWMRRRSRRPSGPGRPPGGWRRPPSGCRWSPTCRGSWRRPRGPPPPRAWTSPRATTSSKRSTPGGFRLVARPGPRSPGPRGAAGDARARPTRRVGDQQGCPESSKA